MVTINAAPVKEGSPPTNASETASLITSNRMKSKMVTCAIERLPVILRMIRRTRYTTAARSTTSTRSSSGQHKLIE